MDEFCLFSRALDADEIRALYSVRQTATRSLAAAELQNSRPTTLTQPTNHTMKTKLSLLAFASILSRPALRWPQDKRAGR